VEESVLNVMFPYVICGSAEVEVHFRKGIDLLPSGFSSGRNFFDTP